MNPLLKMLGGGGSNIFAQLMMQAVGSAMRGETPQDFLRGLANSRPELRGIDLNDLEGSARKLAQQKGVDYESVKSQAMGEIQKYM